MTLRAKLLLVLRPGSSRGQIAHMLNVAYAGGLLSEDTFARRLDQLLDARLVDPLSLVGDLNLRSSRHHWGGRVTAAIAATFRAVGITSEETIAEQRSLLLALDWSGEHDELLLGRHHDCDVVLSRPSVSRRHARLIFRDGSWVLQDLESTNGTSVNGTRVGRCELRPGDRLVLGDEHLTID